MFNLEFDEQDGAPTDRSGGSLQLRVTQFGVAPQNTEIRAAIAQFLFSLSHPPPSGSDRSPPRYTTLGEKALFHGVVAPPVTTTGL